MDLDVLQEMQRLSTKLVGVGVVTLTSCSIRPYAPSQVKASTPPLMDSKMVAAAKSIRDSPSEDIRVFPPREQKLICEIHDYQLTTVEVPALGAIYSPSIADAEESRAASKYFPYFISWHPEPFWSDTEIQQLKVCAKCKTAYEVWQVNRN